MSGLSSTGPSIARPAASAGRSVFAIQRKRSITSAPLAPKRSALPRPSFKLLKASRPPLRSRTAQTGMEGLITPAMGPTAP